MFESYNDVVSVEELMKMLHIGKSSAYSILQNNQIKHVKVGKKYIIPKKSVISFLEGICYNEPQIINGGLNLNMRGETL
ncbi:MAG: helix-turn-helix domain-containing protein [Clostridiales bacterium]|jgi:excisionase family DNA binding protein|nr:helix-turn-helix domain-containing protein [Clostridiales bacterium]